jgi:hypothetical protein
LRTTDNCGSANVTTKNGTFPRGADIKNGSCQKGERAHLQNNIKAKLEQLKLSKTYPST